MIRTQYGFPVRKPITYSAFMLLRRLCWLPGRLGMFLLAKTDGLCPDCGPDLRSWS